MSSLLISHHPRTLPWEMLQYIFSHCDQPTLVSVCLVSFLCWELAGPILYESVEINNLDALLSLFFIEYTTSSDRLNPSRPLLTRIKTLSLEIQSSKQTREPFFDLPEDLEEDEAGDGQPIEMHNPSLVLLVPHRLLSSFHKYHDVPPIPHVVLPNWVPETYALQNFLPTQVLPFLNPSTLTIKTSRDHSFQTMLWVNNGGEEWVCTGSSYSPSFLLYDWTNLERIVLAGLSVQCSYFDAHDEYHHEEGLPVIWATRKIGKRPFELVFDFATGPWTYRQLTWDSPPRRAAMLVILYLGGLTQEVVELMPDVRVVVKVKGGDEEFAKGDIARDLEEWMKPFITVEVV